MAHSRNTDSHCVHAVSEQGKCVASENAAGQGKNAASEPTTEQGKGTTSNHAFEHSFAQAPKQEESPRSECTLEQVSEQEQSASHAQLHESDTLLRSPLNHVDIPEQLRESMTLFLRLIRRVISEYDHSLRNVFDTLLADFVEADNYARLHDAKPWETQASAANSATQQASSTATSQLGPSAAKSDTYTCAAFERAMNTIASLELHQAIMLARAFTTYFHLANLCEEHYRVSALRAREKDIPVSRAHNTGVSSNNDLNAAYEELSEQCGSHEAKRILTNLEFHPVFTAHPTEARRKTVEVRIRSIAALLEQRASLGGPSLAENERRMLEEIDALLRTSPIGVKKPTPVQEADTIIDVFDHTLFNMVADVYRRFDDWELGDDAGCVAPVCPAFFKPGSWIGTDRDGNPNVTAQVSRVVAEKFRVHMLETLASATRAIAATLTLDAVSTPASSDVRALWKRHVEMSEDLPARTPALSTNELHRAVLYAIELRLRATIDRKADMLYASAQDYINDLRIVQNSLVLAGAYREAYGALQRLIWQAQTFGFSMVEMEFRQHSLVHERALADLRAHVHEDESALQPMTREVLDTFRAIASIQRKSGVNAARRYIISFTKSAQHVQDVYTLARMAFACEADMPTLDVIPLFEQVEDLENAIDTLNGIIKLPCVQKRLDETNHRFEVMLGYSDSSKDAGPTSATLVLHKTQQRIAQWASEHNINLVLMHGRGGAVGRGGGPANRAVLAQPKGSVNAFFKLTEQGEVIFARYGDPVLARRHVESVAGATLLQSAPSVEALNTTAMINYQSLADELEESSKQHYLDLIHTEGFAEWFSVVTPLTEIGLMPIGSRPAKRNLGASSLDDLRAIPWIFSWSQARTNLAAWYGLGWACQQLGSLERLQSAYKNWPLFTTFIDNIEMSLAKTDMRLAERYLALGNRSDLSTLVLDEMKRTLQWVLSITGNRWPLEKRRVLGPLIRSRTPFVNVLSAMQVCALEQLRQHHDTLSAEELHDYTYLILCTVSGVAAGLQNTG